MLSFGISAVLAGLAGLMIGPLGSFDLTVGFTYMLLGFAAVVLGGFRSIPGIVLGGVLIGLTEELFGGLMLPMLVEKLGVDPRRAAVPVDVPVRADARRDRHQTAGSLRPDADRL